MTSDLVDHIFSKMLVNTSFLDIAIWSKYEAMFFNHIEGFYNTWLIFTNQRKISHFIRHLRWEQINFFQLATNLQNKA